MCQESNFEGECSGKLENLSDNTDSRRATMEYFCNIFKKWALYIEVFSLGGLIWDTCQTIASSPF